MAYPPRGFGTVREGPSRTVGGAAATPQQERPMYLMVSKGPRKTNRKKTRRLRAKLKAKNRARRNRIYVRS